MHGGFFVPNFDICAGAKEVRKLQVKVKARFRDKTADLEIRKRGEILEVDKDRGEHLVRIGLVEIVPDSSTSSPKRKKDDT